MYTCRLVLPFLLVGTVLAVDFHVCHTGDDGNAGTSPEHAFRTPERALAAMRAARADDAAAPLTLTLRPGTYHLGETLVVDSMLAGSSATPTVIRAGARGTVTVSGFTVVTGWAPWRNAIWRAPVPVSRVQEVYWDGERLPAARVPNRDPERPRTGGMRYVPRTDREAPRTVLHFTPGDVDVSRWQRPETGRLVVWPWLNWNCDVLPITGVDAENQRLITARPARYDISRGNRFYIEHIFEELDAPGEWFFDAEERMLYLLPLGGVEPAGQVCVPRVETLLRLQGTREKPVSHVWIADIRMEGAARHGVELHTAMDCGIRACEITRTGGHGILLRDGSSRNRIVGCDIAWTGTAAICLSGIRNWERDHDNCLRENLIENNHLHHVGMSRNAGGAVDIHPYCGGNITRGNVIRRNHIHDAPRKGIMLGGSNLVEGNHVHHVNLEQSDTGAIGFCTRDLKERGSVVRHNFLHDTGGYQMLRPGKWAFPSYCWGIYLDDWTSGVTVFGNVVVGAARGAFHVHGGQGNIIENNLFVSHSDYQGLFTRKPPKVQDGTTYVMADNVVRRNVVVAPAGSAWLVGTRSWRDGIAACDRNLFWFDGGTPVVGNRRQEPWPWEEWTEAGFDRNSILAPRNPVNRIAGRPRVDPRLAAQIGFEPIDWEHIGLYESPERFSWPVRSDWPRETPVLDHPIPDVPVHTVTAALPPLPAGQDTPVIDGVPREGEWAGAGTIILARDHRDRPAEPASTAWVLYTDETLYIAVDNPVGKDRELLAEGGWGREDAVEVAMRLSGMPKDAPIFLVRGYLGGRLGIADVIDGRISGVGDTPREGLSPARLAAIGRCRYAAQRVAPNRWTAEFAIPWGAMPGSEGRPGPLQFNLTTRKTAHDLWLMWHPTGRYSYGVGEEGRLLPQP